MRFGAAAAVDVGIGGEEPSPDALKFWELFAQNRHVEAQNLARRMASSVPNVTEATYSFDGDEGNEGEKKKPSTPTVKPSTPAQTINAWNYKFETRLISLHQKHGYCLARVGKEKVQDDFRACIKKNCISTGHVGSGVYRMPLPLKDFVWGIEVGKSEKALGTSPQVFSNPTLVHKDFPEAFTRPGGRMYALENYLAVAKVWKVLLEAYPGASILLGYSLVGEDERRSSLSSLGGGLKEPSQETPAGGLKSPIPMVKVQDDDPPGPMDTSLLDEDVIPPSGGATFSTTPGAMPSQHPEPQVYTSADYVPSYNPPPSNEGPTLGGLGDGASDVVSLDSDEDSNVGIRVGGSDPRFGWEAYATQGARVPVAGGGSIAVSDATSLGHGEIAGEVIFALKNKIKRLEAEASARDTALNTVLRSIRLDIDRQSANSGRQRALIAKQETAINKLKASRPALAIPPPTPTEAATVLDLSKWGNQEWDIVTRAVAARQDTSAFLKSADLQGYLTRREYERISNESDWANNRWSNLSPKEIQDQLTAHSRELFEEGGSILSLVQRMERLESNRGSQAVEIGGMTFADEAAVHVFFQTLNDKEAYRFCLDFVSVMRLAEDAFDTEKEGLASKAAAHKAEFNSLNAARVATSFELTYPENILKKSDAADAQAELGGIQWSPGFSTRKAFEGTFHNGTKETMKRRIHQVERTWTNSINAAYPARTQPRINNVFLSQLRLACAQALQFLESLTSIPDLLEDSGMKATDAWKRSAVFPKALFEHIAQVRRTVSEATNGGAMMYGAFKTSVLVEEYSSHNFSEHPKIGLMLCLTAFNREGHANEAAKAALDHETGKIKGHDTRIASLENKLKKMKTDNPNLTWH